MVQSRGAYQDGIIKISPHSAAAKVIFSEILEVKKKIDDYYDRIGLRWENGWVNRKGNAENAAEAFEVCVILFGSLHYGLCGPPCHAFAFCYH